MHIKHKEDSSKNRRRNSCRNKVGEEGEWPEQ